MPRTPRWKENYKPHGILEVRLSSWKYFDAYVRQEMLKHRDYIWRGQRCSPWLLEPTLDRTIQKRPKRRKPEIVAGHLKNFQFAARGRRGKTPSQISEENEWWALGQHHGLKTPLLDWTISPFVAAYFAFVGDGPDQSNQRAVFALDHDGIGAKSRDIVASYTKSDRPPIIEFVRPLSDENDRLVNQGGLFTRAPLGIAMEDWIEENFPEDDEYVRLLKIIMPNKDRTLCLQLLNRMNINHLTLFPDLYGASRFSNMDLAIKEY